MYKDGNVCPICGKGILKKSLIEEIFEYKGNQLKIPDYIIFQCSDCEESIVDNQTLKDSEKIIRNFQRKTDGLLTSDEIRKIRVALGFTQEDFGAILGGGAKAFARYETGQVTQSKAMDNLLRIVDEYPSVLNLIEKKVKKRTYQSYEQDFLYNIQNSGAADQYYHLKVMGE